MSALEPLYRLINADTSRLTRLEIALLELELFYQIISEIKQMFRERHKDYFKLMKYTREKENEMLENRMIEFIVDDIMATSEYDLEGIARYTDTFPEVIVECTSGLNKYPSAIFVRKLIELHRSVRRDVYKTIIRKIIKKLLDIDKDPEDPEKQG